MGPPGSGKTRAALSLASGLGTRIAVIDAENKGSLAYSDMFDFSVIHMTAPHSVEKYIEAIQSAEDSGFEVLILDSIYHQWRGEGGILNRKEIMDSKNGISSANWSKLIPDHDRFMNALTNSSIHIIATMRSRFEYVIVEDQNGQKMTEKIGLGPIQKDGIEYDFSAVLDLSMNHSAKVSTDKTGIFPKQPFLITPDHGTALKTWMEPKKIIQKPLAPKPEKSSSIESEKLQDSIVQPQPWRMTATLWGFLIQSGALKQGWTEDAVKRFVVRAYGLSRINDMTKLQYDQSVAFISKNDAPEGA